MEEWKDIKGYEGKYQVSNYGRVKSLNYHRQGKEQILKSNTNRYGYKYIILHKEGNKRTISIHKLVAETFIFNDDPVNKIQVNHKDEDKTNNHYTNLEWCTAAYNTSYGTRSKRAGRKISEVMKGKHHTEKTRKKLSEVMKGRRLNDKHPMARKVQCINTGEIFNTVKEAAKWCKLKTPSNISCQIQGKSKTAGKHPITGEKLTWKYVD